MSARELRGSQPLHGDSWDPKRNPLQQARRDSYPSPDTIGILGHRRSPCLAGQFTRKFGVMLDVAPTVPDNNSWGNALHLLAGLGCHRSNLRGKQFAGGEGGAYSTVQFAQHKSPRQAEFTAGQPWEVQRASHRPLRGECLQVGQVGNGVQRMQKMLLTPMI
ncbi:hypothetical protein P175DRAFT_0133706 [Aspergillus ochraceoroseus IBT 24754]|uniref:Uncharacterized protein n=1 Tax=Aspergillus ochraceoroseus IBT 24754 TaxID=1392256 RepID=A0A2T5M1Q8_9EURO|nr:uncharacterized protein P175DRAFT_0133706 [Aspergillus ochraceoroseus IBT 24754]PTU22470.1 hypothetical protein P175DRAFT_0133706 [Aspergillus ochraceoroseus IBT 24754]